ncbi:MFS transporter [Novosphingobium sp. G106]|uniref:MFS transporter n=1 Tax=Novosphingobium sp. G106 TaxID=2849500 RepID=UPI001C2CC841|nr:MFS transporter [Novosphingobium sp. G106]MBV1686271.1 MFS transporter [Novosphingobium sp. G106]
MHETAAIPSSPRHDALSGRSELRRHWKALLGACLGMGVGAAAYPIYIIPVIGLRLEDSFGWTHTQTASLSSLALLGGADGAPFAGRFVDTSSVRIPALTSTVAVCLLLFMAGFAGEHILSWQIGAFLLMCLGSASLSGAYSKLICSLFLEMRGLALGIVLGNASLLSLSSLSLMDALFDRLSIRSAFIAAGMIYVLLFLPLLAFLLPPAQRGASYEDDLVTEAAVSVDWRALVLISAAALLITMATTGSAAQLPQIARQQGEVSPVALGSILAFGVLLVRPATGFLVDRLPAWAVTSAVFGAAAVGLILLMLQIPGVAVAGTLLIAGALGGELDLIAYLVARYVPARRFGTVFGRIYAGMLLAGAAGPILLATVRDRTGDYGAAFGLAAGAAALAALLITMLAAMPARRSAL